MSRRSALLSLLAALVAVAALTAFGWPERAYRDQDFGSLWVMARMLLEGRDQYDYAAFVAGHEALGSRGYGLVLPGTGAFYPVTTALFLLPFAALPFTLAAPVWLVVQAAVTIGTLVALARRLAPDTLRRDLPLLVAFAVGAQPVWIQVEGGNMGGLVLGLAGGAVALLLARRPLPAGALAGVLLVVKPHPLFIAMVLILLAVPRHVAARMLAAAAAAAGATVAVSVLVRPGWIGEFLAQMGRVSAYAVQVRQSTLFGMLGPQLTWLSWIVAAAIVLAFLLWLRARPPLPLTIGAAVCVSLFAVPYGFSYDHILLLIPVAIAVGLVAHAAPLARAATLAALAVAFTLVPWVLYALAFQRGDESLNALAPLAVLGALALGARAAPPPSASETQLQ